jgi:hypothetical protein
LSSLDSPTEKKRSIGESKTVEGEGLGIPTMSGKKATGMPRVKAATIEALVRACSP